jgi:hypothetical protein
VRPLSVPSGPIEFSYWALAALQKINRGIGAQGVRLLTHTISNLRIRSSRTIDETSVLSACSSASYGTYSPLAADRMPIDARQLPAATRRDMLNRKVDRTELFFHNNCLCLCPFCRNLRLRANRRPDFVQPLPPAVDTSADAIH